MQERYIELARRLSSEVAHRGRAVDLAFYPNGENAEDYSPNASTILKEIKQLEQLDLQETRVIRRRKKQKFTP